MPVQDLGTGDDTNAWYQQMMAYLQSQPQGAPATPQAGALGQTGGYNPADVPSPYASNMSMVNLGTNNGFVIPRQPPAAPPVVQPPASPVGAPRQPPYVPTASTFANTHPNVTRPGYYSSTGAGSGDPRGPDAAMNRMAGMAPGVVNSGYRPPNITPGIVAPAATPAATATAAPAAPNLGYYRPAVGNARQAQWMPPDIGRGAPPLPGSFPGPLAAPQPGVTAGPTAASSAPPAAPAAAAAQGPVAPGAGTRWLQSLFGGGGVGATPAPAAAAAPNPNNPYWGPNTADRAAWGGPTMPYDITNYPVRGVNA
jgi:hypothetical protein